MSKYFPLHCHSHFSLLDGLSKPKDIARRCIEIGAEGSALTDHGNISGAIAFSKAMTSRNLKPIIGVEFYICQNDPTKKNEDNRRLSHLLLLAKNLQGWRELIEITSTANHPDHFYYRPRLDLDHLASLPHDNIIALTGHFGSTITDYFFRDSRLASTSRTLSEARGHLKNDMKEQVKKHLDFLKQIFKDQFFVEIQMVDHNNNAGILIAQYLREFASEFNISTVATPDAHYARQRDAGLQQILLCTSLGNTTFGEIRNRLYKKENLPLAAFFKSTNYHIPSYEEMLKFGHSKEELRRSLEVAEMCELYKLTDKPMLPKFKCPNGMTSMEYIRHLCREGWISRKTAIQKVLTSGKFTKQDYTDRFTEEFAVLEQAQLGDYFLIVHDFVKYAKEKNILIGAGRGSAAGSLILYLLNVTHVDPVEYGLLFSRFYNAGRNTKDRISLPDVDMDFEKNRRGEVIEYIKNRFGHDHVAQMITFNRMQGRSALKDVLRTRNACGFAEMNLITEHIPGEEEIADQLQNMKEADKAGGGDGEASIIRWALENHSEELKEWAHIDEDGDIQGRMGKFFEQAIAIEGTKRSQGKHAAGIVISSEPLHKVCPMVYDAKSGETVAGMEMNDLEAAGHVKFDILGVALLDKIHGIQNLLETGEL